MATRVICDATNRVLSEDEVFTPRWAPNKQYHKDLEPALDQYWADLCAAAGRSRLGFTKAEEKAREKLDRAIAEFKDGAS